MANTKIKMIFFFVTTEYLIVATTNVGTGENGSGSGRGNGSGTDSGNGNDTQNDTY